MIATICTPPKLEFSEIPEEIRAHRRWVTWNPVERDGKITKRPVQNIARDSTWLEFNAAYQRVSDGQDHGLGYVLGDGVVGIDLDRCIDARGNLHPIALDALALGSYAERSPSGRGLHVIVAGSIKSTRNIRSTDGAPGREIYDGGRFFTVTGDRISVSKIVARGPEAQAKLDGFVAKWFPDRPALVASAVDGAASQPAPSQRLSDEQVLQRLFASKNGAKARRLYGGDSTGYPSASEADYDFTRCVRFYTQDANQIARIFLASGRVRDKIVVHPTYLRDTISKALRAGGKVYRPESAADRVARLLDRQAKAEASIPLWMTAYLAKVGAIPILVLLVIAAYGDASPSIATIAWHLGLDESLVCRGIKMLEDAEVLSHERQFNAANKYRIIRKRTDAHVTPFAPKRAAKLDEEQGKAPDLERSKGLTSHESLTNVINTGEREEMYIV